MPSVDEVVRKAWEAYRSNFSVISIGVILSILVAMLLLYIGTLLLGIDWIVMFLSTSYLFGAIYVAARVSVEPHQFEESSLILARYVLAFAIFTLLVTLGYVLPYPINVLFSLAVISVGYLAVPIVAELGFREGLRRVIELLKKVPAGYVGLNWLFFLGLLAILSIFINPILAIIGFFAITFYYLPLYSLTAYFLARSARLR
ncbi:MAG: hypothetical protein GXO00_00520 [Candidatus Diapherotrites archaeon]|nr:hypothetical protein [Candidatus Diapherotrites archaeon]